MLLKTEIKEDFLKLFYHDIIDCDLGNQNRLNLFILRISNNRFSYQELAQELFDNIIPFSLSRQELEKYKDSRGGKIFKAAINKFRNYSSNEGELGEILLYCFLEAHLNAPKILTKLEIKTSNNDYVKGADGVHLLELENSNFQLIFGESKLNSDLKTGIYEAFKSVTKFIESNKIGFEINLVNSQLIKESIDEKTYQYLQKIIIPNANEDKYNLDNSFGIFLGFDFEITEDEKNLSNNIFRNYSRNEIKKIVFDAVDSIKYQITNKKLWGYNFYIYTVPFTDLPDERKQIIQAVPKVQKMKNLDLSS